MIDGTIQRPNNDNRPLRNYIQGKDYILKCSKCDCPLVSIASVKPDMDVEFVLQSQCGQCGDHSFEMTIKGEFIYGIHEPEYVSIVDVQYDNNKVVFLTTKTNEWGK